MIQKMESPEILRSLRITLFHKTRPPWPSPSG